MVRAWKGELIGSYVKVVDSKNKTLVGLEGKVIDETKNTITLEDGKKIIKSHVIFEVDGEIVEGKTIQKRPEDRIKK